MAVEAFYDTTTRADVSPPSSMTSGQAYSNIPGVGATTWQITGNQLVAANQAGVYMNMSSVNNYIGAKIAAKDTSSNCAILVHTDVAQANGFGLSFTGGSTGVNLIKYTAGVLSNLASAVTTHAVGDDFIIAYVNTNLYVFKNGTLVYVNSDGSYVGAAYSYTGLRHNSGGVATNWRFTNIHGGTVDGTYQPVIGTRMAYDRDGTRAFNYNNASGGAFSERTTQQLKDLNDESTATVYAQNADSSGAYWLSFVFPELRTVTGAYIDKDQNFFVGQYSTDTTNGYDGSWNSLTISGANTIRSPWYWAPVTCKGLKFSTGVFYNPSVTNWRNAHLYGLPNQAAGVHRLQFWHPFLDMPLPGMYLDFDDVGAATIRTRSFRIKNMSTTLTANTITIAAEDLTTPATSSQITFKKNSSGGFASNETIASLAAGALSEVIQIKRITPSDQVTGVIQAPRINLTIGSFT